MSLSRELAENIGGRTSKGTKITKKLVKSVKGDEYEILEIQDHTQEVINALDLAMARALEAIGIEAESDAADICPVDTGRLRNSITHTIEDNGDEKSAIIGTNVEYALAVHNGTSKQKAQPFLVDAVTNHKDEYSKRFSEAFNSVQ